MRVGTSLSAAETSAHFSALGLEPEQPVMASAATTASPQATRHPLPIGTPICFPSEPASSRNDANLDRAYRRTATKAHTEHASAASAQAAPT